MSPHERLRTIVLFGSGVEHDVLRASAVFSIENVSEKGLVMFVPLISALSKGSEKDVEIITALLIRVACLAGAHTIFLSAQGTSSTRDEQYRLAKKTFESIYDPTTTVLTKTLSWVDPLSAEYCEMSLDYRRLHSLPLFRDDVVRIGVAMDRVGFDRQSTTTLLSARLRFASLGNSRVPTSIISSSAARHLFGWVQPETIEDDADEELKEPSTLLDAYQIGLERMRPPISCGMSILMQSARADKDDNAWESGVVLETRSFTLGSVVFDPRDALLVEIDSNGLRATVSAADVLPLYGLISCNNFQVEAADLGKELPTVCGCVHSYWSKLRSSPQLGEEKVVLIKNPWTEESTDLSEELTASAYEAHQGVQRPSRSEKAVCRLIHHLLQIQR
jgi:hypothetical protein